MKLYQWRMILVGLTCGLLSLGLTGVIFGGPLWKVLLIGHACTLIGALGVGFGFWWIGLRWDGGNEMFWHWLGRR